MRMVFGLVLLVGLALAGAAVFMAQGYIGQTQAELVKERQLRAKMGPLVEVFVVKKPLNYGDPLTPEDVQKIFWQKNALPEGTFSDEAVLFPDGDKTPRFVLRQMEAFEPILAVKVTEPGEAAGLTTMLKNGQRAFTIQFGDAAGASRYLQPGNTVDVFWTGASANGNEVTQLIETAIEIIAVDRPEKEKVTGAPKSLTVAASPEQVARLTQGQASGQLSVALVGKGDTTAVAPIETSTCALLGNCAEPAPILPETAEVAVPECHITTRKGTEVVQIPIPCTN